MGPHHRAPRGERRGIARRGRAPGFPMSRGRRRCHPLSLSPAVAVTLLPVPPAVVSRSATARSASPASSPPLQGVVQSSGPTAERPLADRAGRRLCAPPAAAPRRERPGMDQESPGKHRENPGKHRSIGIAAEPLPSPAGGLEIRTTSPVPAPPGRAARAGTCPAGEGEPALPASFLAQLDLGKRRFWEIFMVFTRGRMSHL